MAHIMCLVGLKAGCRLPADVAGYSAAISACAESEPLRLIAVELRVCGVFGVGNWGQNNKHGLV